MAGETVDDLKELRASLVQLSLFAQRRPEHGHREACASSSGYRSYGRVIEGEGEAPELDPKAVIPAAAVKREGEEDWGR
jgi:hypothetical protein